MSVSFFALAIIFLAQKIFHRKIFSTRDWAAAWIFGAVASLVLYPSALGLTHIDTYTWGWTSQKGVAFVMLLITIALATIFLLWRKNKFGVLLLLALLAFAVHAKASTNFWDYLIDPIYGVMAFVMIVRMLFQKPCSTS
ncbi:MAG: hypothetical protein FJ390_01200 [Verrucomicrobia bacterium]|nr:hypothetical protein [Verrucomicrobiota bacterium]